MLFFMIIICLVFGFLVFIFISQQLQNDILNEKCDPEAYIAKIKKLLKIPFLSQRFTDYININISAAYILSGEFLKAYYLLRRVDKKNISTSKNSLFAYYNNLITCLYAMGDISTGEDLFEKEISEFNSTSEVIMKLKNCLSAERLFYLEQYGLSREILNLLPDENVSRINYVYKYYHLALIDEIEGKTDDALAKFREVAEKGNKLYIAQQARLKLGI